MPRESLLHLRERTGRIITALQRAYPDAHCELDYRNPLELLIATILSAQCTDKQVNRVTKDLFRRFRTAEDFAGADLGELEQLIHRLGFFRMKAKNIRACCQRLVDHYQGDVPNRMEALVTLNGVGRKTANVVLGNAFGMNEGVVVDTHVTRLSHRLALSRAQQAEKIEKDLVKLVPRELWCPFSHWLIWHGRRRCPARKPDCRHCEIREDCPGKVE